MKCSDAREMINSYLDNKTDPMDDSVLAEHIKSCPECRAELEFLLKYRKVLSEIKPVPAPENFMRELHRKIELEIAGGPFKRLSRNIKNVLYSFRFPLEAAGVAAIALMVFFLYKPFFSDKVPVKTTDYAAQTPRGEISGKLAKPESDSLRSSRVKTVPQEKKLEPGMDKIIADEMAVSNDILKHADTADKSLSEPEKDGELPAVADKKKSRFMMKEESKKSAGTKDTVSESVDAKSMAGIKKDEGKPAFRDAEKIFRELGVSVVQKNVYQDGIIHYKVKVHSEKYSLLIKRLKEKFSVKDRILTRRSSFYEMELFLERK